MSPKSIDTRAKLLDLIEMDLIVLEACWIEKSDADIDIDQLWRILGTLSSLIEKTPFVFLSPTLSKLLEAGDPQYQSQRLLEPEYRSRFIHAVIDLCTYFRNQDEQESISILQRVQAHIERMQSSLPVSRSPSAERESQQTRTEAMGREKHRDIANSEPALIDTWDRPPQETKGSSATGSPPALSPAATPSLQPSDSSSHDDQGRSQKGRPAHQTAVKDGEGVGWFIFDEGDDPTASLSEDVHKTTRIAAAGLSKQLAESDSSGSLTAVASVSKHRDLVDHYLVCCLGTQHYALPIDCVREILAHRIERPLPSSRPGIIGLVTLRGQVFPVIDVSGTLFANQNISVESHPERRCMIVCEVEGRTFCFRVDEVKQVVPRSALPHAITPLTQENQIHRGISHATTYGQHSLLFVNMHEVVPA